MILNSCPYILNSCPYNTYFFMSIKTPVMCFCTTVHDGSCTFMHLYMNVLCIIQISMYLYICLQLISLCRWSPTLVNVWSNTRVFTSESYSSCSRGFQTRESVPAEGCETYFVEMRNVLFKKRLYNGNWKWRGITVFHLLCNLSWPS